LHREASRAELDVLCRDLEEPRGGFLSPGHDGFRGLAEDDAREAHRAPRMRAAAFRDAVGVALDQLDAVERNAQPLDQELREAGLVALAARERADHGLDAAVGPDRDLGALGGEAR